MGWSGCSSKARSEAAGLPAPEYEETENSVKLILRNNIDVRAAHRKNNCTGDGSPSSFLHNPDRADRLRTFVEKNMLLLAKMGKLW